MVVEVDLVEMVGITGAIIHMLEEEAVVLVVVEDHQAVVAVVEEATVNLTTEALEIQEAHQEVAEEELVDLAATIMEANILDHTELDLAVVDELLFMKSKG
jgi:hypothetical protein